jgi:hypothetical protein
MNEASPSLHQALRRAIAGPETIGCPAIIMTLARFEAKKFVKRKLQAMNVKVAFVAAHTINSAVRAHLQEHAELIEGAQRG